MDNEIEFKNYKEKQKYYKEKAKSYTVFWQSKEPNYKNNKRNMIIKGRTYVKPKEVN